MTNTEDSLGFPGGVVLMMYLPLEFQNNFRPELLLARAFY